MILKDSSPLLRRLAVLSTFKSLGPHTTLSQSPTELAIVWKQLEQFTNKFLQLFCMRDGTTAHTDRQAQANPADLVLKEMRATTIHEGSSAANWDLLLAVNS